MAHPRSLAAAYRNARVHGAYRGAWRRRLAHDDAACRQIQPHRVLRRAGLCHRTYLQKQTAAAKQAASAAADENSVTETAEVPEDGSTPGEAVLTGASDFAAQAKLSREQVRSQSKADLQAILNNTEVGDDQKQEAVNTMVQMTEIAEKEAAAEMLLEAKGFENAVVNLTGETADVVVPEADLEDSRRAQIEDIVKRKTGIAPENIVITPLNESEDTVASEDASVSEDTADDGTAAEDQAEETATYDDQETSGEEIVTEGIYD
mgnify:CR=1 FL=1